MAAASVHAPFSVEIQALEDGTVLRPFLAQAELEACVELQRRVWGADFADVASPAILKIAQAVGGVAAGAFGPAGGLLGFVFGLTGIRDGRPVHWSHMLAVLPEARGRDLGFHLKAFQRLLLLPLGVETVEWTYDPLVAKNAHLNLVRLGARPVRYLRDYYGTGDDSALSAGIGTDRFVVEWRIAEERVERAIGGEAPHETGGGAAPVVRVEVPADVHQVRRESPERAARWRASTRAAFEALLGRGYTVEGFERTPAAASGAARRCFYLLRSPR
jgi:predicted GNAT superfamily acetyltransferase